MSYIYVKKDLRFIEDPAAQSLLKAFLKAVYSDEYIEQCEEEFGFVRVGGSLRDMALEAIDALVTDPAAPEWTFETDTIKRIGQGDYVISQKRKSYSEIEQEKLVEMIGNLQEQIIAMQAEIGLSGGSSSSSSSSMTNDELSAGATTMEGFELGDFDESEEAMAALIMSSVSIALWIAALIGFAVKAATGGSSTAAKSPDMTMVN